MLIKKTHGLETWDVRDMAYIIYLNDPDDIFSLYRSHSHIFQMPQILGVNQV